MIGIGSRKRRAIWIAGAGMLGFLVGYLLLVEPDKGDSVWNKLVSGAESLTDAISFALAGNKFDRGCSPKNACIANLKMLDGAKATWALEFQKATNEFPSATELFGETNYIRAQPQCPMNGTYTLGRVDQVPRCSIAGHTL